METRRILEVEFSGKTGAPPSLCGPWRWPRENFFSYGLRDQKHSWKNSGMARTHPCNFLCLLCANCLLVYARTPFILHFAVERGIVGGWIREVPFYRVCNFFNIVQTASNPPPPAPPRFEHLVDFFGLLRLDKIRHRSEETMSKSPKI